jgi:general secretion pathway protein F
VQEQRRDSTGSPAISLDQFVALNDELAALVRARVPMERALSEIGRDVPGTLGETMRLLASRMSRGETLAQAIAAERERFPGIYHAVVAAGLKAGRLPAALEGLAGFSRQCADLRHAVGAALIYPAILVTLAWSLLLVFVFFVAPQFVRTYDLFRFQPSSALAAFTKMRDSVVYWGPVVPVLLALAGWWWVRSGRVDVLRSAWTQGPLGWFPALRRILLHAQTANFAELLGLLVENQVRLPESLRLAAETTGSSHMAEGVGRLAASLEGGGSLAEGLRRVPAIPPFLCWLIGSGVEAGVLAKSLRHAAATYRETARYQSQLLKVLLPVVLVLAVGATVTAGYALTLFVPFTSLLFELAFDVSIP